MTPWELLSWAVALGASAIVLIVAIVVAIAGVKAAKRALPGDTRRSVKD